MLRQKKKLGVLAGLGLLLIASFLVYSASASPSAQAPSVLVTVAGTAKSGVVTYDVTVVNNSATAVNNIYLAASIPGGTSFDAATATPKGAWFRGVEGNAAVWLASHVPANGRLGPFTYKARVTGREPGSASAYVHWTSPSDGSATSTEIAYLAAVEAGSPKRGCTACHVLIDNATGKYTLTYEAEERAKAAGGEHPKVAPDGTSLEVTNMVSVATCLLCHKPGTGAREGKGAGASLALRDIVHPAHMFSEGFKGNYGGNCYTCHNVSGDGTWQLLPEKVHVNDKGVPETGPIPGALSPSQR